MEPQFSQDPALELSPSRRDSIEHWLDTVDTRDSELEYGRQYAQSLPPINRDNISDAVTATSVHPGSSRSDNPNRPKTFPPAEQTSHWPELLKIPPGEDPKEVAQWRSQVWPMGKVDLVRGDNSEILNNKHKIIQDYVRHLVRSALQNNQNADIVVGQASLQLEPDYRRNPIGTLRQMLLTMVQEMNDDDREIVQMVLHSRGICQSWRCFMCKAHRNRRRGISQ